MSEKQFKVGQKVKCVDSFRSDLALGEIYTIRGIDAGGLLRVNGTSCLHYKDRFVPVQEEFNMKTEPWKIKINSVEELRAVEEWVREQGMDFEYIKSDHPHLITFVSNYNTTLKVTDSSGILRYQGQMCVVEAIPEIKLTFCLKVDKFVLPQVKSNKESKIERIESEMRKLADELGKLKGE